MTRHFLLLPTLLIPLALAGCAKDGIDPDEVGDGDGDGDSTDTGTDTDEPANWVPALGIAITEVEANQGTRVPIGQANGEWVDGAGRNTFLTSSRDTLIRVHFTVDPGWTAHDVRARLTLTHPSLTEPLVREQDLTVEGDSTPTSLTRTFYFGLIEAEGETLPGANYQIELFEKDTEQNTALPELANVTPASGPAPVGFESDPMQMKIVLVPIHYTGDGKDMLPDLGQENLDIMINRMFEENPLQEIIYEVRAEPVPYTQTLNQLGSLLPIMAQTKQADGADANVYYHAIITTGCLIEGCASSGTVGIANLPSDSKNDSLMRVAASILYDVNSTADTFVHEVGHNQGLSHVYCPDGMSAGNDPAYPYPDGEIGNWGFGIRNFSLHNPTASHDYMTYCGNTWPSDWTFNKTYLRIRELTSWDFEGAPAPEDDGWMGEELLVGALYPDGSREWFTIAGKVDPEEIRPDESLEFQVDGQVVAMPTIVRTLSDDQTQWVYAPLPTERFSDIDAIAHVRAGERSTVEPASVRLALPDTIAAP
ncbi:zinc-dependent metalloprotease family protein [Nannocystaceae bacterium ST9]